MSFISKRVVIKDVRIVGEWDMVGSACAICFKSIRVEEPQFQCPFCRRRVHQQEFNAWIEKRRQKRHKITCPYCHQDVEGVVL